VAQDDKQDSDFEQDLERLEALIVDLEGGDLSLEEGVEHYRQGVALLGGLNRSLHGAEQRVEELTAALQAELAALEQDEQDEQD